MKGRVTTAVIASAWWPLAMSWLLMAAEQPAIAAVVARLPEPELNLAAYGGVVFPIALVIEAPIIMLLAASTELSRDKDSYQALRWFSHRAGFLLAATHLLLAATPLFDVLMFQLLAVPAEVAERARIALLLLTPWSWAIASRRTGQGVLIRYGHSRSVGVGTAVRLLTTVVVLAAGMATRRFDGATIGAASLSVGVLAEAGFVALRVRAIAYKIPADDPGSKTLRGYAFWAFYLPLMMMPLVTLITQPIGTAGISRLPGVVASLACWPVLISITFVLQSVGLAYNEVMVALLGRPGARPALGRFAAWIGVAVTAILVILIVTPLDEVWFGSVTGLSPELTRMATDALVIVLPIPAARVLQSWYQGLLVNARRTGPVTEAVIVFAIVSVSVLLVGIAHPWTNGLGIAMTGFTTGRIAQVTWLGIRAHMVLRK